MIQKAADKIMDTSGEVIFKITDEVDKKKKERPVIYDPKDKKNRPTIYNEVNGEFSENPEATYNKYKKDFDIELKKRNLTSKELIEMQKDINYYFDHGQDPEYFFEAGQFKFIKPREEQKGKVKSVGKRSYIEKILPDIMKGRK